jgi:hypothetical protein
MARAPLIDLGSLSKMLGEKTSQAEVARQMKVSPSAICKAIKRLKQHVPKVVALEKAKQYAEYGIDMLEEYRNTLASLNTLRDGLEKYIYKGDRTVFAQMERKTESRSAEFGAGPEEEAKKGKGKGKGKKSKVEQKIERFDFTADPHLLLIQCNRAIKELLSLQVDIFMACADPRVMIGVLNKILDIMRRISPEARYEIEQTLKQDALIRSVISFDAGTETDMRDPTGGAPPS